MHPLHAELDARMITEQRLHRAATARRLRAAAPARPGLRDRVGSGLVRVGTRLQRPAPAPARHATPC